MDILQMESHVLYKIIHAFLNIIIYIGLAYGCVVVAMTIDLASGIQKAKLSKIARTSRGFKMTVDKARKYFSPMFVLTVVDIMLCVHVPIPTLTFLWAAWLCYIEFKSVREKHWQKEEMREAAQTMSVIINNKDDIAKAVVEIMMRENEIKKENDERAT